MSLRAVLGAVPAHTHGSARSRRRAALMWPLRERAALIVTAGLHAKLTHLRRGLDSCCGSGARAGPRVGTCLCVDQD